LLIFLERTTENFMPVTLSDYENLLAYYSDRTAAVGLLKQYRPYLEMLPSMRRPLDSLIVVTLPIVRADANSLDAEGFAQDLIDYHTGRHHDEDHRGMVLSGRQAIRLPCDLALLMCDPEWQVKTGVEVFVYIHRPQEGFYDLLSRWRRTQILLDQDYEWIMPLRYRHVLSDRADRVLPLFVTLPATPSRIVRGLKAAGLPYVVTTADLGEDTAATWTSETSPSRSSPESSDAGALLEGDLDPLRRDPWS
jgi:hypothetical protein